MSELYTSSRGAVQNKQMHYSPNLLLTVMNGIDNCLVATIEHESREKGISVRDIEPMGMIYKDGRRNLVAWCRLRNEYRSFRLERINCIRLKQEVFDRRQDFRIEEFQNDTSAVYQEDYPGES